MPITKASNAVLNAGDWLVPTPIFGLSGYWFPYIQGTVDGRTRYGQNSPESYASENYVRYNSSIFRWQIWATDSEGGPDSLMDTSTTDGTNPWNATWATYLGGCFINTGRGVDCVFDSRLTSGYSGSDNIFIGGSNESVTSGHGNIRLGFSFSNGLNIGINNVAIGKFAMGSVSSQQDNTALGNRAYQSGQYSNSTCLGANSSVTGNNQVQLGNAQTTTYAFGAVQNRSDVRDKADIRDTELGLEFVNALRPVDFKWDMREDYRPEAPAPVRKPFDLKEDASEEEKTIYARQIAEYNAFLIKKEQWEESIKLSNITHDGSKKRSRFHHGLIAQEVKAVLDAKGIDFGGLQDHKIAGGDDVLSIGYVELIAPLIKAVQELSAKVAELEAK